LPYLDPRRTFRLRAVLYHEGNDTLCADVRCDSGDWVRVHVGPRTPDTVWVDVPRRLYRQDGKVVLELARISGGYAALAELKFFTFEEGKGGGGDVQGTPGPGILCTRLLGCAPNPFGRATFVSYQLGRAGPVTLTVHDVSGRLVRRLEGGPRPAGSHRVRWNGTDDHGLAVPAGVYFLRFSADGAASSRRATLVR
jgi:hypothetical protein